MRSFTFCTDFNYIILLLLQLKKSQQLWNNSWEYQHEVMVLLLVRHVTN